MIRLFLLAENLSQEHEDDPKCLCLHEVADDGLVPPVVPPVQPELILQLDGGPTVPPILLPGAVPLLPVASAVSLVGGDGLSGPQGLLLAVHDGDAPVPLLPLPSTGHRLSVAVLPNSFLDPEDLAKILACSSEFRMESLDGGGAPPGSLTDGG